MGKLGQYVPERRNAEIGMVGGEWILVTITAEQLSDLRVDMGGVSTSVFDDTEIERYWARMAGATSDTQRHRAVLALMYEYLLANATKLHDYTAGATGEKLSQIYAQLEKQFKKYEPDLLAVEGIGRQFARRRLRAIPRQGREFPSGTTFDIEDQGF